MGLYHTDDRHAVGDAIITLRVCGACAMERTVEHMPMISLTNPACDDKVSAHCLYFCIPLGLQQYPKWLAFN